MITQMTKEQAEFLAQGDRTYRAKPVRNTDKWCVWCDASDHVVDFDRVPDLDLKGNVVVNPYWLHREQTSVKTMLPTTKTVTLTDKEVAAISEAVNSYSFPYMDAAMVQGLRSKIAHSLKIKVVVRS